MSLNVEPADGRIVRPTTRAACVAPGPSRVIWSPGCTPPRSKVSEPRSTSSRRAEGLTGEHRRRHVPPQPFEADRADLAQLDRVGADAELAGAQERGPGHPGVARQSLCDGRSLVAVERQAHLEVPAGAVSRRRGQQARHAGGDDECSDRQCHAGRRRGHRGDDRESVPALAGIERERAPVAGTGGTPMAATARVTAPTRRGRRPRGGTTPAPRDGGRHHHDHRRRHDAAEHRHGHVDPDAPTGLGPPRRCRGGAPAIRPRPARPRWAPTAGRRRRPAAFRPSTDAGGSCRARTARQDRIASGPGAGCTRGRRGRYR